MHVLVSRLSDYCRRAWLRALRPPDGGIDITRNRICLSCRRTTDGLPPGGRCICGSRASEWLQVYLDRLKAHSEQLRKENLRLGKTGPLRRFISVVKPKPVSVTGRRNPDGGAA
jgi:hypothetical protein